MSRYIRKAFKQGAKMCVCAREGEAVEKNAKTQTNEIDIF